MRATALLVLFSTFAGADGWKPVERKDWVADWSKYVMRSTVTAAGKLMQFLMPAPRARREILLRSEFEAQVADGRRQSANPPVAQLVELLAAGPLKLKPLEVIDLAVDDARVRTVELTGDAVMLFWSLARPDRRSTLYVQGRHPGRSTVRVSLADGGARLVQVDVPSSVRGP